MRGDFHVRFCEKLGLKCPCLLDPVLGVRYFISFVILLNNCSICVQSVLSVGSCSSSTIVEKNSSFLSLCSSTNLCLSILILPHSFAIANSTCLSIAAKKD